MFVAKRPARCSSSSTKPKGLWKAKSQARVVSLIGDGQLPPLSSPSSRSPLPPPSSFVSSSCSSTWSATLISSVEEEEDYLGDEVSSVASSSSGSTCSSIKRRRIRATRSDCSSSEEGDYYPREDPDQVYLWDYSSFRPSPSSMPMENKEVLPTRRVPRRRVDSSIGLPAEAQEGDEEFTWEDWEQLQEMFIPFQNDFSPDSTTAVEHLPALRAIIHECQRFLSLHPNASQFFLRHSVSTPPTAVYTLLGHALFVFGLIISIPSTSSSFLETEPKLSSAYWLAALDVFAIGDSSTVQKGQLSPVEVDIDWKMSLSWGMTMVRLSREIMEGKHLRDSYPSSSSLPGSPLDFITLNRPPHTPSSSTSTLEVKDLLKYAMDQITRGIFHMPRVSTFSSPVLPPRSTTTTTTKTGGFISLLPIAVEVFRVVSQLPVSSDRVYWLRWADSLFSSCASTSALGGLETIVAPPLLPPGAGSSASVYRGKCHLLLVRALVEAGPGEGEEEKEWKEEVVDCLVAAIEFFEEWLGSESQTLVVVGSKRKWVEEDNDVSCRASEVEEMLKEAKAVLGRFQ